MSSKFNWKLLLLALMIFSCREKIIQPSGTSALPPPTPQMLKVISAYDGVVVIQWQTLNDLGISKYLIYRSINKPTGLALLDSTADNYYSDDSLYYDSTYYYAVASVNSDGIKSKLSESVSAKPVNVFNPYPPFSLTINAKNWNDTLKVYLSWNAPLETDINHYEIYRGLSESFRVNSNTLVGKTAKIFFVDTSNLKLLTEYYYKVLSVDNGGLRSKPTGAVKDIILDRPKIIAPENDAVVPVYFTFKFIACSAEASYKVIIQSNKLFGTVAELNVGTEAAGDTVSLGYDAYYLERNKTYYWRVVSYSGYSNQANSFSELATFRVSNF